MNRTIDASARVADGAVLGEEVRIGPFCVVEEGTRLGDGCVLGPHVVIHAGVELGPGCRVHAGAVLGDTPQDLSYDGAESGVRIGRDCVLREGVTVHRGTKAGSLTEVGDGCYLMAFSHLGHNVRLGKGVILANGVLLAGYVEVGEKAFLSGHCVVHQFCRIGRLAMVGGLGGVGKDVPPFCVLRSHSVNTLAGLNVVGLRRAGFAPAERLDIKRAYRVLFQSGLNLAQACARLRAECPEGPGLELVDFVESSTRGVCVPPASCAPDEA